MRKIRRVGGWLLGTGATVSLVWGCAKHSGITPGTQPPKPIPIVEPAADAVGAAHTGSAAIVPASGGLITDAQVRTFALSHHIPAAVQASQVAIVSTSFISSKDVRVLLHSAKLGVPDDEPMCLVILSGKFAFAGPPGQMPTFPIGVEVFDARTGHLLQSGGLPRAPEPPKG